MSDPRTDRWRLPDGVDELLPDAAWRVERLRRAFIDRCRLWGFELVMPPLIEYVESLLTGSGETMDLQTFKLVDQQSGRTLGVRADMTPQVARIDAHALAADAAGVDATSRLCYVGTVLRARADTVGGSRSPQQFGAELFGHAGFESDVEMIRLMLETVALGGVPSARLSLDLGHVGVYRALADDAGLAADDERAVFDALRRGSVPDLLARLEHRADSDAARRLAALPSLRGDVSVIGRARDTLAGACEAVGVALATLERVVSALARSHPGIAVHVDLAELRGYRYHTGVLFAVLDDRGAELAHGGRYDRIGAAFGRARPATGFSGDLVQLADRASEGAAPAQDDLIHAAQPDAAEAAAAIAALRAREERVLARLPGERGTRARCARELVREGGRWTVRPIETESAGDG